MVEESGSWSNVFGVSRLRELFIIDCPLLEVESFPRCPQVKVLSLENECEWQLSLRSSSTSCSSDCPSPEESIAISRTKWQLSLRSLQDLKISNYRTLKSLQLDSPQLKNVDIKYCNELLSIQMVVPQHLQDIFIRRCKQLKSIEPAEAHTPTPSLRCLSISECPELESLTASTRLIACIQLFKIYRCHKLRLPSPTDLSRGGCSWSVELIEQLSSLPIHDVHIERCTLPIRFPVTPFTSLRTLYIEDVDGLEVLQLDASPLLQVVCIWNCVRLTSVVVEAPISIGIFRCPLLKNLHIAHTNALNMFSIEQCSELKLGQKLCTMTTQPVVMAGSYALYLGITFRRRSEEPGS